MRLLPSAIVLYPIRHPPDECEETDVSVPRQIADRRAQFSEIGSHPPKFQRFVSPVPPFRDDELLRRLLRHDDPVKLEEVMGNRVRACSQMIEGFSDADRVVGMPGLDDVAANRPNLSASTHVFPVVTLAWNVVGVVEMDPPRSTGGKHEFGRSSRNQPLGASPVNVKDGCADRRWTDADLRIRAVRHVRDYIVDGRIRPAQPCPPVEALARSAGSLAAGEHQMGVAPYLLPKSLPCE